MYYPPRDGELSFLNFNYELVEMAPLVRLLVLGARLRQDSRLDFSRSLPYSPARPVATCIPLGARESNLCLNEIVAWWSRRLDVCQREVLALVQERLPRGLGQRVRKAVPEVQPRRVVALAVTPPGPARGLRMLRSD